VETGQAHDKILLLELDQMPGASSGTATFAGPKGYLTSLDSVAIRSETEICDIKRAQILFDSLVKPNPKHAPGWSLQGNPPKLVVNTVQRVKMYGSRRLATREWYGYLECRISLTRESDP